MLYKKPRDHDIIETGKPAATLPKTLNLLFRGGQAMITHSFDPHSGAIITPAALFGEQKGFCNIAIATFSREIYPAVLERYPNEQIAEIRAANRIKPVHLLTLR